MNKRYLTDKYFEHTEHYKSFYLNQIWKRLILDENKILNLPYQYDFELLQIRSKTLINRNNNKIFKKRTLNQNEKSFNRSILIPDISQVSCDRQNKNSSLYSIDDENNKFYDSITPFKNDNIRPQLSYGSFLPNCNLFNKPNFDKECNQNNFVEKFFFKADENFTNINKLANKSISSPAKKFSDITVKFNQKSKNVLRKSNSNWNLNKKNSKINKSPRRKMTFAKKLNKVTNRVSNKMRVISFPKKFIKKNLEILNNKKSNKNSYKTKSKKIKSIEKSSTPKLSISRLSHFTSSMLDNNLILNKLNQISLEDFSSISSTTSDLDVQINELGNNKDMNRCHIKHKSKSFKKRNLKIKKPYRNSQRLNEKFKNLIKMINNSKKRNFNRINNKIKKKFYYIKLKMHKHKRSIISNKIILKNGMEGSIADKNQNLINSSTTQNFNINNKSNKEKNHSSNNDINLQTNYFKIIPRLIQKRSKESNVSISSKNKNHNSSMIENNEIEKNFNNQINIQRKIYKDDKENESKFDSNYNHDQETQIQFKNSKIKNSIDTNQNKNRLKIDKKFENVVRDNLDMFENSTFVNDDLKLFKFKDYIDELPKFSDKKERRVDETINKLKSFRISELSFTRQFTFSYYNLSPHYEKFISKLNRLKNNLDNFKYINQVKFKKYLNLYYVERITNKRKLNKYEEDQILNQIFEKMGKKKNFTIKSNEMRLLLDHIDFLLKYANNTRPFYIDYNSKLLPKCLTSIKRIDIEYLKKWYSNQTHYKAYLT